MSRLPTRLQPLWPVLKRGHRLLSLLLGIVFRLLSRLTGGRGVPTTGTTTSAETARREPGAVTLHPGGPAETISRGPAIGDPAGHWIFRRGERDQVPERYTLEITGGRLTGDFGATSTPGGILDYQTSGYFGLASWREHPVFLKPTLGRVQHVDGTLLSLTTRGTAINYYHFLYDAIARYGIFAECLPGVRPDAIVVPHQAGYMKQFLALAGLDGVPLLQPQPGLTYTADRLLVPSTPNQDLAAPSWVVSWLRERLPASPEAAGQPPVRLYLSRGDAPNTRRYVEEAALWPELEKRGFTLLDPGSLSVQQQIDVFSRAEAIVAPHGAGLTNVTFAPSGVRVLEMFAAEYVHLGLYNICEAIGGVEYRYLVADGKTVEGQEPSAPLADISIPVDRVLASVDALLTD